MRCHWVALATVLATVEAAPEILAAKIGDSKSGSSARYERITIQHGDGNIESWNLMVLTVAFSEPLFIDWEGTLTRIDEIPMQPAKWGGQHAYFGDTPPYAFPLNLALGSSFRLTGSDEGRCGEGYDVHGDLSMMKHLKKSGDDAIPSLSGMPPIQEEGGKFVVGQCIVDKHKNQNWQTQCPIDDPNNVVPTIGAEECVGKPDFSVCPGWMGPTQPWEQRAVFSMFCYQEQCVGSLSPHGAPMWYTMVMPPTKNSVFTAASMRQGAYMLPDEGEPNKLKLAFFMPGDDPNNPDDDLWWSDRLSDCGFKVHINDNVQAASPFGVLKPGEYPFPVSKLKGKDGNEIEASSVDFPPGSFTPSAIEAMVPQCDAEMFQVTARAMITMVEAFKSAKSTRELQRMRQTVAVLQQDPSMRECNKLMDSLVTTARQEMTVGETRACMLPEWDDFENEVRNADWEADCKCNRALRHEVCCLPSAAKRIGNVLQSINEDIIDQKCRSPAIIKQLIADAVASGGNVAAVQREEDIWQYEEQVWQQESAFRQECEEEVHQTTCQADGQCKYGMRCDTHSSTCRADEAEQVEVMMQCYLDKMTLEQSKVFKARLGDPSCEFWLSAGVADTSLECYSTLRTNFLADFARRECMGHDSHLYRGEWVDGEDEYGEWFGYHTEADEAGCLKDGYCIGDDQWPRTTFDMSDASVTCANEGAFGCFECHGSDCWSQGTRPSGCEVISFRGNQTLCEAGGFSFKPWEVGRFKCIDESLTTPEACVPDASHMNRHTFPHRTEIWDSDHSRSGGHWTYCADVSLEAYYTAEDSNGNPTDWKYFQDGSEVDSSTWHAACPTHANHRGYCYKDYDDGQRQRAGSLDECAQCQDTVIFADSCPTDFTAMYAKQWVYGKLETQDKCALGCSDSDLFHRGVSKSECISKKRCTQQCSYCGTWNSNPKKQGLCVDAAPTWFFTGPSDSSDIPHENHQTCANSGGELLNHDEWDEATSTSTKYMVGCGYEVIDKDACTALNSSFTYYTCDNFGSPEGPAYGENGFPQCRTWRHDPVTNQGTQIWPKEIVAADGTVVDPLRFVIQHRIGCDYNRWRPCRTDKRMCDLGTNLPDYSNITARIGTIDCARNDLEFTSAECEVYSGTCNDHEFHGFGWDQETDKNKPGCLMPLQLNQWGDTECDWNKGFHWARIGCNAVGTMHGQTCAQAGMTSSGFAEYSATITRSDGTEIADSSVCYDAWDKAKCDAEGGQWVRAADDAATCTQFGDACFDLWGRKSSHDPKANAETGELECGGCLPDLRITAPEPIFTWTPARYVANTWTRSLQWKQYGKQALRAMGDEHDWQRFDNFMKEIVGRELGRQTASDFMREWIPKNALIATVACACTNANASLGDVCFLNPEAELAANAAARAEALAKYGASSYEFSSGAEEEGLGATTSAGSRSRRQLREEKEEHGFRRLLQEAEDAGVLPPQKLPPLAPREAPHHPRRLLNRRLVAATPITAAEPQETAIGVLYAGKDLELTVNMRGSALFRGSAVDNTNDNAEVELKALPAAMMNSLVRERLYGTCAGQMSAGTFTSSYEVVADACGTVVGTIISDGLMVQAATTLKEQVYMCITPRTDIPVDATLYPIDDVVVDRGSGDLSPPLGISVSLVGGDVCFYGVTGTAYVPIKRMAAYATEVTDQCAAMPPSFPPCPPAPPPSDDGGGQASDSVPTAIIVASAAVLLLASLCGFYCYKAKRGCFAPKRLVVDKPRSNVKV